MLEDSEISLRQVSIADFDVMCAIELDPENIDFTTLEMPDVNDIRAFLLSVQDIILNGQLRYSIIYLSDTVGFVDLTDFVLTDQSAAVGIYILKQFRGLGIGKMALSLLQSKSIEHGIQSLFAEVKDNNQASIQLFLGAGYEEIDSIQNIRRFHLSIQR